MTKNQKHVEHEIDRPEPGIMGEWGDTLATIADWLHTLPWDVDTCDRIAGALRVQGFHIRRMGESR